ncbi:MAG: TolC family protein [Vulcanimicrobiaceae bacterium]
MRRLRATLFLAILCPFGAAPSGAHATPPTVSLASLELKLPQAPALLADELQIEAAAQSGNAARAKSGLSYLYSNSFGPAAIIVPRSYDYHILRYEQSLGVSLPLFGSNAEEQLAIVDAQEREQLARIALAEARRERLAVLREAYVQYWEYDSETTIARGYLGAARDTLPQARVLLRTGFWTTSKLLDLLDAIDKVASDAEIFRNSQLTQLAQIEAAVGYEMPPFASETPAFFSSCVPDRRHALDSAYRADATLAQLDAQIVVVRSEYARASWSSLHASATLKAGFVTDINQHISGYDLQAGVDLSAPRHGHAEERDVRAEYAEELQSLALREQQRHNDLDAAIDALLHSVANAHTALHQSLEDLATREQDLRKALVRYHTIHQAAGVGFSDVQERRDEVYAAQRAAALARGALLLQANQLLLIAPGTCDGSYEPMP